MAKELIEVVTDLKLIAQELETGTDTPVNRAAKALTDLAKAVKTADGFVTELRTKGIKAVAKDEKELSRAVKIVTGANNTVKNGPDRQAQIRQIQARRTQAGRSQSVNDLIEAVRVAIQAAITWLASTLADYMVEDDGTKDDEDGKAGENIVVDEEAEVDTRKEEDAEEGETKGRKKRPKHKTE